MRPHTLSEAFDRVARGEPLAKAMAEFLDHFAAAGDGRAATLADEPAWQDDPRMNALAAAMAHYLAHHHWLPVPAWTWNPARVLDEPWFTAPDAGPGLREWLVFSSPAEFITRNIFTDEAPLRRKGLLQPGE